MAREKYKDSFWLSYSDLMTSLFFIMLLLFVVCICKIKFVNRDCVEREKYDALVEKYDALVKEHDALVEKYNELNKKIDTISATKEQLEQILQLDAQFAELSKSSALQYIKEKKMFVAKDFIGKEIFKSNDANILQKYIPTVDSVGQSLQEIVKRLHETNPNISFQLVIEGNAAIPWSLLKKKNFNPDAVTMYELSYHRALALYRRWSLKGINLRRYNTEVIIAGSGFNGINRDNEKEENNKRFIIHIIPKVSRPE